MRNISALMLSACILWYAAISTMNPFALAGAAAMSILLLPWWATVTASKTGRKPWLWLLVSILLPVVGPLILSVISRKDIAVAIQKEKEEGKKNFFERKFGVWGGIIPYVLILVVTIILFTIAKPDFLQSLSASRKMPYKGPVRYVDTTNGNSTANLANGGLLHSTGQYELFSNLNFGGALCALSVFDGSIRPYSGDAGSNLCAFSDYIYYINHSDNDRIYRVDVSGNAKEPITEDPASQFCIGEMIYYIKKNDNNIYRVDYDGKGRVKLGGKKAVNLFQLYGDLYYINVDDENIIYTMTSEGKRNRKLLNDQASQMFYANGRIYYINLSDEQRIYSIEYDGTDRRKESEHRAGCICSDGFELYYSNLEDEGRIYRMQMEDGEAPVLVVNDAYCQNINIVSTTLTYTANGIQKFVNTYDGSPNEKYYPAVP
jgi:hypothetical protein